MNCYPILYQWTGEDGLTHHGNSVCCGRTRIDAEWRFFRQHPHVRPIFEPHVPPDAPSPEQIAARREREREDMRYELEKGDRP